MRFLIYYRRFTNFNPAPKYGFLTKKIVTLFNVINYEISLKYDLAYTKIVGPSYINWYALYIEIFLTINSDAEIIFIK